LKNCGFWGGFSTLWRNKQIGFTIEIINFAETLLLMIQRIQSLFLFLVDIVLVILLFVPYISASAVVQVPEPPTYYTLMDNPGLLVGQVVLCILATATMALYRNRALQMKLCLVGVGLSLLYTLLMAYNALFPMTGVNWNIESGTYVSIANTVLFLLARNFIKRDDNMVKSADRIR
jgi:hypothetical protein